MKIRSEWTGKLWEDEDGIVYLNTHDSGPSLAMGANAFELADLVASNAIGKRVRIVIETIDDAEFAQGERRCSKCGEVVITNSKAEPFVCNFVCGGGTRVTP